MTDFRFGSVCSGIEAASVAWHPLGWRASWLAEIEAFPAAVLAHHYPQVPNLGDMTTIARRVLAGEVDVPDVLVGGTPCQAFSVAGLRQSLADERGNLTLKFVELADAIDHVRTARRERPAIVVWENVPGVLSTPDNAFGCFLGALAGEDCELQPAGKRWSDSGCVYGPARTVAWRILDAQYFGLAQRRRRVFVVASARDGFDPAAVLFEFDGVRRDTPPSRETQEGTAAGTGAGAVERSQWWGVPDTVGTLCADTHPGSYTGQDAYTGRLIPQTAHTLRAEGFDASEDGTGCGTPLVPCIPYDLFQVTAPVNRQNRDENSPCHTLARDNAAHAAVVFNIYPASGQGSALEASPTDVSAALNVAGADNERGTRVVTAMQVRRLTPRECERLQGFPDDYTLIPWKAHQAWAKRKGTMGTGESFDEFLRRTTGRGLREPTTVECPDGPRYKALGNSMAVPVMAWIGRRIADAITSPDGAE